MPDTRESGDGSGPPPASTFARQPDGRLSGAGIRRLSTVLVLATALSVVAWPPPLHNARLPEAFPPPTRAEMERFCSKYEEVKNLSFSEMAAALVDYAPGGVILDGDWFDMHGLLVEASEHRPGIPRSQGRIFDFIAHCPPVANGT